MKAMTGSSFWSFGRTRNNTTIDFKNRIFEMVCSMISEIHQHPTADGSIPALKRFAGNQATKKIDEPVKSGLPRFAAKHLNIGNGPKA
jgi:hypothetical protein